VIGLTLCSSEGSDEPVGRSACVVAAWAPYALVLGLIGLGLVTAVSELGEEALAGC
jgi:hypothetical protein